MRPRVEPRGQATARGNLLAERTAETAQPVARIRRVLAEGLGKGLRIVMRHSLSSASCCRVIR